MEEQIEQLKKAIEEFGLKIEYSEEDGTKYLEIFSEDGNYKHTEWCKYADGTFNYR